MSTAAQDYLTPNEQLIAYLHENRTILPPAMAAECRNLLNTWLRQHHLTEPQWRLLRSMRGQIRRAINRERKAR